MTRKLSFPKYHMKCMIYLKRNFTISRKKNAKIKMMRANTLIICQQ